MTINEVLNEVESTMPGNKVDEEQKIKWLDRLDKLIFNDLLQYKENQIEEFDGYTSETDRDTKLLVVSPYDELYVYYIKAQINLVQQEVKYYNNNIAVYEDRYRNYRDYINRSYKSKGINFIKV